MTPLERAARALFEYEPGPYGDCVEWAIEQDFGWRSYVEQVKLVLEAIREPSDAMMLAAEHIDLLEPGVNDVKGEWTAMIDAILAGGE